MDTDHHTAGTMSRLSFQDDLLQSLNGRSVIVTGAARGIGAATATLFNEHGALVCITDLPARKEDAQALIDSMKHPENAIFAPASVTDWTALMHVFKTALSRFGVIHMVVANAGIMESSPVLDVSVDDAGDPIESKEANRVLDVNLKGTLNTLRLSLHYMTKNSPTSDGFRGSVVLVASISGYFGSTGNAAYIASKHGVIGLLRASLDKAASLGVRVNAVTPGYTPTGITKEFGNVITQAGLDANTPGAVATAIAFAAADPSRHGTSCLVLGPYLHEMEYSRANVLQSWLGQDAAAALARFGAFVKSIGGYRLPKREPIDRVD
ncbi:hypothetical protein BN1708_010910 [Verticillium longisporum]|uniref:Uncharacterized protein n=2 Tax=Verticillium longisporum TaxID=100787 RepID=A0A0G4KVF5_VERLO|nr:hypothetical protein BN1708_010910 [Verticillium longisporum]